MEIEPFLIASSVEMVIAQRLVREDFAWSAENHADISESELQASLALLGVGESEVANLKKSASS